MVNKDFINEKVSSLKLFFTIPGRNGNAKMELVMVALEGMQTIIFSCCDLFFLLLRILFFLA